MQTKFLGVLTVFGLAFLGLWHLYPTQLPYPKAFLGGDYISIPVPNPSVEIKSDILPVSRISFYNPVPRQTDADPSMSACGPTLSTQIAISQDLFFNNSGSKYLCGRTVTVVTDRGEVFHAYVVNDTMNVRYKNSVDVMLPHTDENAAMALGITSGYIVFH